MKYKYLAVLLGLVTASPAIAENFSLDCDVHDVKTGRQLQPVHVDVRDVSITMFQGEFKHTVTGFDISPAKIEWAFYTPEDNVVRGVTIDRTNGAYAGSIGPTTATLRPSAAGVCKRGQEQKTLF